MHAIEAPWLSPWQTTGHRAALTMVPTYSLTSATASNLSATAAAVRGAY